MNIIKINTPFYIELEFVTAGTLKRAGAIFIDFFFIEMFIFISYQLIFSMFEWQTIANQFFSILCLSILPFFYFPFCEIWLNGQSMGKKILGLKVMSLDGLEPTTSQYLLRWLIGIGNYSVFILPYIMLYMREGVFLIAFSSIFLVVLFYLPDFLSAAISRKNQRLGDIAAGTTVIDLHKKMEVTDTIYREIDTENNNIRYPQVMRLSDRDINGIRNLLDKKVSSKTEYSYRHKIVQKICTALDITEEIEEDDLFLEQLLDDYNRITQQLS